MKLRIHGEPCNTRFLHNNFTFCFNYYIRNRYKGGGVWILLIYTCLFRGEHLHDVLKFEELGQRLSF